MRPFISLLLILLIRSAAPAMEIVRQPPATNDLQDLSLFLDQHLSRLKFPALAAAVMTSDKILAAGAVGVRKLEDEAPVTLHDKFHIGSVTKSMTALLAVLLAEEGKLSLTNGISDLLPSLELRDEYRPLTLRDLLQHRSGMRKQAPRPLWKKAWNYEGSGAEQRALFIPEVLLTKPEVDPLTEYHYSNLGYAVAGTMIETHLGQPWEDLLRERIFGPLWMRSAGFGPPSSDLVDQPWGHTWRDEAFESVPPLDNPPAIGPGGTVHCTVLDLARYASFHLAIARGEVPALVDWRDDLYEPPPGQDYALGWIAVERPWAGGKALTHSGTNTMFYCLVWLAPNRDLGFIVMTNAGNKGSDNNVHEGCDSVVAALIKRFLPRS